MLSRELVAFGMPFVALAFIAAIAWFTSRQDRLPQVRPQARVAATNTFGSPGFVFMTAICAILVIWTVAEKYAP